MSEPQTDQVAASQSDSQSAEPLAAAPGTDLPQADAPLQSDASAPVDTVAAAQADAATAEAPVEAETAAQADAAAPTVPLEPAPSQALTADAMPLVQVIEALLFATDVPLSPGKLAETVGLDSTKPVKAVIDELNAVYTQRQAAYRIEERAGGYQLLTLPQYAEYIERLVRKKDEGRLTPASLETLAIVAYKQPIIRADVEAIRGVACGEVLRSLMEHNMVKIIGRAEIVGRPMLYGTTRYFLEVFGLANLKDLPKAEQLKEPK